MIQNLATQEQIDKININLGAMSDGISHIPFIAYEDHGVNGNISANGYTTLAVNVSKTGYTPIGIIQFISTNIFVVPASIKLVGNQAVADLRNTYNAQFNVTMTFRVLYIRNN